MHFRFVLFIWYFTKEANEGNKNSIFAEFVSVLHLIILSYDTQILCSQTIYNCVVLFRVEAFSSLQTDEITHGSESHLSGSRKWCVSLTVVVSTLLDSDKESKRFNLFYDSKVDISSIENAIKRFSTLLQKYNFT